MTATTTVSDGLAPRVLCFHKQSTSGRTRFLRLPHGMLGFAALPAGSSLCAEPPDQTVRTHPAAALLDAARRLGLPDDALRAETEFDVGVATPAGMVPVLLAQFTSQDPPFAAAEKLGGRFIAITEARDCGDLELQLMRRAYEIIMG